MIDRMETAAVRAPVVGQIPRKGSYGIDAPYMLPVLGIFFAINAVNAVISRRIPPLIGAMVILFCAFWGLHTSRRGKFLVWADLLDELKLRGDEKILDLGCGRGAVLFLAAQHLSGGRAVGVDIWNKADQSGNSEEAARRNALAEGVADRIELVTADMTQLPMDDGQFDLIVSNVAIHNVKGRARRARALEEAVRVLRPGGRLLIADLRCTSFYRGHLAKLGMIDIVRRNLGWRMWWSGPWAATRLVSATKPPRA
jgi:arsenite methyltransferase